MHIHDQAMGGLGVLPEATLFQRAQSGCPDSLNVLMARHDGLVQAVVRRQVLGDLPFAEALQAGRIGLWRAIQGYDPKRGTAFSTYAWPCIMRQVWRAVKVHTDFDLLLRLLDYTPLRPVLAQLLGWTSARGQVPFDPVSMDFCFESPVIPSCVAVRQPPLVLSCSRRIARSGGWRRDLTLVLSTSK